MYNNSKNNVYNAVIMTGHCESSHDECRQRQVAADLWTIYYLFGHLLLFSVKADNYFIIPWRVEGWVSGCYNRLKLNSYKSEVLLTGW